MGKISKHDLGNSERLMGASEIAKATGLSVREIYNVFERRELVPFRYRKRRLVKESEFKVWFLAKFQRE